MDGDLIDCRGQKGRLIPALQDLIRQNKAGLMDLIRDLPVEMHHIVNQIVLGDACERLKNIPDNCIDSTITDPPYGLQFMDKDRDTVKPLKLMSYLVTMFSRPRDIILDPFCGSGTTCIAAQMLRCRFIGIEKDQTHHEIAVKRLFHFRNKQTQKGE